MLKKGLVQVYTGDGKGKTTAAFGLALRAVGQGHKVLIYQFLKPATLEAGERFALELSALRLRVEALDIPWDMAKSPSDDKAVGRMRTTIAEALEQLAQTAEKRFYDILILDEIVYCLATGLTSLEVLQDLIKRKHRAVEVVMTGRGAPQALMDMADLVTEMRCIKHPFEQGIPAREGIEY
jgi:cob(I)alamin adenosyltransferase